RFILGYEFWKAGVMKYNGENWFESIKENFPFPFSTIPTEISWFLATWTELIGAVAIIIGLATRFFSAALVILTIVAILGAHMPAPGAWDNLQDLWNIAYHHNQMRNDSYGFEIPLLYLLMLLPLVFVGPGRLSLDYLVLLIIKDKHGYRRLDLDLPEIHRR
ncbi:MAG: DoxX family protein, partial [Pseudomonadota bacterium]